MDFLKIQFFLFICALFLHETLVNGDTMGDIDMIITCPVLHESRCAFAIDGAGKRCVLEAKKGTSAVHECVTSEVVADYKPEFPKHGYLESAQCIAACGVNPMTIGMSSDALLDPKFTLKLCSPECSDNCPNIIDLYKNLAAGEGAFLPSICEALNNIPQRSMVELLSSGGVLGGQAAGSAPAPAPM